MGRRGAHAQGPVGEPGQPGVRGDRVGPEGDQAGLVQGRRSLCREESPERACGPGMGSRWRRAWHSLGTEFQVRHRTEESQRLDARLAVAPPIHFSPVSSISRMKYFCATKYKTTSGTTAVTAAAIWYVQFA